MPYTFLASMWSDNTFQVSRWYILHSSHILSFIHSFETITEINQLPDSNLGSCDTVSRRADNGEWWDLLHDFGWFTWLFCDLLNHEGQVEYYNRGSGKGEDGSSEGDGASLLGFG